MDTRSWLKRTATAVLIAAVVLAMAGCNVMGTNDSSTTSSEGVVADKGALSGGAMPGAPQDAWSPEGLVAEDAPRSADGANVDTSARLVVKNGTMQIEVSDIDRSLAALKAAAKASSAEIADMSVTAGTADGPLPYENQADRSPSGPAVATVTLRVPAERLDALTAALSKLGKVTSQTQTSSDVTEQAIDMEARLKNLRAQEAQLRQFFKRATKVTDLLAIEQELARVRGEIEAMDAQLTYLKRQAARATLIATLSEPAPIASPAGTDWGIGDAFTRGIRAAVEIVNGIISVAIALLPLALLAAAVIALVRWRRKARVSADAQPTPNDAPNAGPPDRSGPE